MRRQSFFQELERSSNLHDPLDKHLELTRSVNLQAAGKRPVLQRQLQNGRLPYDVQGLFQGVGAQLQSP